jgi:hypothetical protein
MAKKKDKKKDKKKTSGKKDPKNKKKKSLKKKELKKKQLKKKALKKKAQKKNKKDKELKKSGKPKIGSEKARTVSSPVSSDVKNFDDLSLNYNVRDAISKLRSLKQPAEVMAFTKGENRVTITRIIPAVMKKLEA